MIKNLIHKNRSYRRFDEAQAISEETLRELVGLARMSASASNRQALRFMLSCTPESNAKIFPQTAWAGYIIDWDGPKEGERPAAYIIILGDTEITENFGCDHGIAAQSILLGAVERGLGGCMLGALQRADLREAFDIPKRYRILLAIALGVPAEEVVIDEVGADGSIKYWRDELDVHHVPKRSLDDLIFP